MGNNFSNLCNTCMKSTKAPEIVLIDNPEKVKQPMESAPLIIRGFNTTDVQSKLEDAKQEFLNLINEGIEGGDCEIVVDNPDCKVSGKETSDGYLVKYQFKMPYEPEALLSFLQKLEKRPVWDKNVFSSERIAQLDPSTCIIRTIYKKQWAISSRENLIACKKAKIGEAIADFSTSVESEELPVQNDYVRVKLFVGGYYYEPIEKDENGNITLVTSISHLDIGMTNVMNKLARKLTSTGVPKFVKTLMAELKKDLEEAK
ncbi:unnamed protein product [Blepharisma stoltei]|uniref:START domain-containing protein n=1 Tax=Blepharisma stoltei TaxID=1481888 RepID=A0AAU9IS74_9CILI|nr:unnamed protein product [Blepharisma stoltei]